MVTIDEALVEALTPPDHYYGAITDLVTQGWAQVAGIHRDSDTLSLSNWETMLKHYQEKYEVNDDFRVEGSSHWLVGWSDCLLVRALQCECKDWEDADFTNMHPKASPNEWLCLTCERVGEVRPIFEDAIDFQERLDDYPVLDDADFYEREQEELMKYLESEVGEEDAPDLASYLFDEHSVSCADDVMHEWIEQWRKSRPKSWRVTVYAVGMKEIATWELKDMPEAEADDTAWKQVHSDYPDHYDWELNEID